MFNFVKSVVDFSYKAYIIINFRGAEHDFSTDQMAYSYFPLQSFISKYKKTRVLNKAAPESTLAYLEGLNTDYAAFIRDEGGFCSYAGGLFSTIDPFDYVDMLDLPGMTETNATRKRMEGGWSVPVIKTGFGDFLFCDLKVDAGNDIYHSFYNERYNMGSGIGYLFTMRLTEADFLNKSLKKRLFTQAVKKFGELKADENFSFPMDFPWDKEKDLEKIDNVLLYKTLDYFNQLSAKHAPAI